MKTSLTLYIDVENRKWLMKLPHGAKSKLVNDYITKKRKEEENASSDP